MSKFFITTWWDHHRRRLLQWLIVVCCLVGLFMGVYPFIPQYRTWVRDEPLPDLPQVDAETLLLRSPTVEGTLFSVDPCNLECRQLYTTARAGISLNDNVILQGVVRSPNDDEARKAFHERQRWSLNYQIFHMTPYSRFRTTSAISYRSPLADRFTVACGVELKPTCRVVAQYDIYIVYTTIDITQWKSGNQTYTGEGIAIEEIDTLLRMIDQQIAQQFNLPLE